MVKNFLLNLLLSFLWVALTGSLSYTGFVLGFVLGFVVLWVMNRNEADRRYFFRLHKVIGFGFYFLYELLSANLQVAYEVITPGFFFRPGVVRYPLSDLTDFEINVLCTFISLTPGTLILDVSEDKKAIYVHVMYLTEKEAFINNLKVGMERRLLQILR